MTGDDDREPQLELQKQREIKPLLSAQVKMVILVGAAVCCSYFAAVDTPLTKQADNPPATVASSGTQGDKVTLDKRAEIDGMFSAYTARLAPLALEKNKDAFLAQPYLSPAEKEQLWAELENNDRKLVAITLWDNFDEDGDVVTVQSEGVTLTVPIMHAPTTVYLPYKAGASLTISGARDGGGGITAAVETMSGAVPLPVMSVGQTIVLPLL